MGIEANDLLAIASIGKRRRSCRILLRRNLLRKRSLRWCISFDIFIGLTGWCFSSMERLWSVIHLKYCCRVIPSSERCIWLLNGSLPVYNLYSSAVKIKSNTPSTGATHLAVSRIILAFFTSSLNFEFGLLLLEHLQIKFNF
jgi:hypothetical protein